MRELPMFSLNYNPFDEWVRVTNRCICRTYNTAYETGEYIVCKVCDGFICRKDSENWYGQL